MVRRQERGWLSGKHAVVTGGAGGIGLALAREIVSLGGSVTLLDRDDAVCERAAEIGGEGLVVDVADRQAMGRAADVLRSRHGGVSLLVNNAGVSVAGRFDAISDEDFDWLFGVNFWGVVNGCRAFLPLMRGREGAAIVNVCSSFAWLGVPGKSAYASSKAAVRALSESLRGELAGEIGVTLLFPGPVDTNLVRRGKSTSDAQRDAEARFVAARGLSVDRVARRCLEGVRKNRARVIVGLDYRLIDAAARVSPTLALAAAAAVAKRAPMG